MKCPICERAKLEKVEDIILKVKGHLFVVNGERCSECKEEFPFEKETQKTIEIARRLGEEEITEWSINLQQKARKNRFKQLRKKGLV